MASIYGATLANKIPVYQGDKVQLNGVMATVLGCLPNPYNLGIKLPSTHVDSCWRNPDTAIYVEFVGGGTDFWILRDDYVYVAGGEFETLRSELAIGC